jgi:uncharacterized protein with ParB-like and HNH nuclease domain
MDSQLKSISKIFTEKLFRIPDYQRGYAWQEKQWKDFWSDVVQLEDNRNHYVGVLTFEVVPKEEYKKWKDDLWIIESKSYEPFYVVDGQQRLTTTLILLQAIIDSVESAKELNYTSIDEIRKRYLFDSKDGGISKSYIFGYDEDNPSYEFLKTKIFNEDSNASYLREETIYTHNLGEAKKYFLDRLKNIDFIEIEKIFKKVTQQLLFNIYSISSDIDVHVTFEGMNNRGKPLSVLELLKNRLIYLSTRFKADKHEKSKLRDAINDSWKSIYYHLGRNKDNQLNDDKFLLNHFIIYFGNELIATNKDGDDDTNNKKRFARFHRYSKYNYANYLLEKKFTLRNIISDSLPRPIFDDDEKLIPEKEKLKVKDIHDYVGDLSKSVQIWYDLFNPYEVNGFSKEEKKWIDKLIRIDFSDFAPLIMVAYKKSKNKKERLELLKAIERFKFVYGLANYRYRRFLGMPSFQYLSNAMRLYNGEMKLSDVINCLNDDVKSLTSNADFLKGLKKDFQRHGYYRWDLIRYFLFEYEESLKEKSKTQKRKIDWHDLNNYQEDFITVEHIYPQKAYKRCWTQTFKKYTAREKKIIRDSLGNLLPLSRAKNSSLQNDCFADKVNKNDSVTIGFRYGSYSENEITGDLDWNGKRILSRGIKLLSFMEERWNFKIGKRTEKVNFLDLEFIEKKK